MTNTSRIQTQFSMTVPSRDVFLGKELGLHLIDYSDDETDQEATPVILLHGVTGSAALWNHCSGHISSRRRVVALDFPGHGDSHWDPDGQYTTERYAEDVLEVIRWLGEPVDIVGLSWGGLVGVHVADTHPEMVRQLVIIDSTMSFTQSDRDVPPRPSHFDSLDDVVSWEKRANEFGPDSLIELVSRSFCRPRHGGGWERKHDRAFFHTWPFRNDDRWDQLSRIKHPVLLVRGQDSKVMPRSAAERIMAVRPQTSFIEIPSSGHLVPIDAPDVLGPIIHKFLTYPPLRSFQDNPLPKQE